MSCFVWLVTRKACLTQEVLPRRGLHICSRCLFCGKDAESNEHRFLHCQTIADLLHMFFCVSEGSWELPRTILELLCNWKQIARREAEEDWWQSIPSCIWWTIWMERNSKYFKDRSNPIRKIKMNCREEGNLVDFQAMRKL